MQNLDIVLQTVFYSDVAGLMNESHLSPFSNVAILVA